MNKIPVSLNTFFIACIAIGLSIAVWQNTALAQPSEKVTSPPDAPRPSADNQRSAELDRVVAIVNKTVVTMQELKDRMVQVKHQLQQQGISLPDDHTLQRQLLERLVMEQAQLQHAEQIGLHVDDGMIDIAIQRIADNNKITMENMRETLKKDGITWERFRRDIRDKILLTQVRQQEVERNIQVSDAEVNHFLENNPNAFSGTELLISHILIRLPESPSDNEIEAASNKAAAAQRDIEGGKPFSQAAAAYSDAPDALEGGSLGWREIDRIPGFFITIAEKLQPGDVSPILRSSAGLHIIKLENIRQVEDNASKTVRQTHARHILLRTSEILSDADAEARLHNLRERIIQGGEDFATLAKTHSVDLSSANGGDLGWLNAGDTVPDFEKAMDALAPMEVSEPIKSPFGWHLIQVLERREQDISGEYKRNAARSAIHERKSEEAYSEWLQQLRDETFVKYHLDDEDYDE